jgi:hypothetical protein
VNHAAHGTNEFVGTALRNAQKPRRVSNCRRPAVVDSDWVRHELIICLRGRPRKQAFVPTIRGPWFSPVETPDRWGSLVSGVETKGGPAPCSDVEERPFRAALRVLLKNWALAPVEAGRAAWCMRQTSRDISLVALLALRARDSFGCTRDDSHNPQNCGCGDC